MTHTDACVPCQWSRCCSKDGYVKILEGPGSRPSIVDPSGTKTFLAYDSLASELANTSLSLLQSRSLFAGEYSDVLREAIRSTERLSKVLANASLATVPENRKVASALDSQLRMIAKLIKLDTGTYKRERAAFVATMPGYDTHNGINLNGKFRSMDTALMHLVAELKDQGVWNNTMIVAVSEFGRSLTSNTLGGTDHGWGGHYFVLGGGVRGGQILGRYPHQFATVMDSYGKLEPTTSWEALWSGVGEWMGLDAAQRAKVLPNAANFPEADLFTAEQLTSNYASEGGDAGEPGGAGEV